MTDLRRAAVAVAAIGSLLAATACSGQGGRLSKERYIERAGQICAEANKKIRRLPHPDLADPDATSRTVRRLLAIQHGEVEDLRALRPPEVDEPTTRKWLGLVNKALDEAESALAALQRGDRDGVNQANSRGGRAQLEADDLARGYGITGCVAASQQTPPTSASTP